MIDKAKTVLLGNRTLLQKLQASAGVPVSSDEDDPAYASFNEVFVMSDMMMMILHVI